MPSDLTIIYLHVCSFHIVVGKHLKKFDDLIYLNLNCSCVLIKFLTMWAIRLCVVYFVDRRQGEGKGPLNAGTPQFTSLAPRLEGMLSRLRIMTRTWTWTAGNA